MPILDELTRLGQELDVLTDKARLAVDQVQSAGAAVKSASVTLSAHSQEIERAGERASQAGGRLVLLGEESASAVAGQVARMSASASEIEGRVSKAEATVRQGVGNIVKAADEGHKRVATRLEDLEHLVAQTGNQWDQRVKELIDAVQIGAAPLTELLDLYGQADVQGRRLFEFLENLPLDHYERQVREFIASLRKGAEDLASVRDFLSQSNLEVSKQLLQSIELFKQGKITLQAIADIVRNIEKLFPDSQLGDLAQAVLDGLREGSL